MKTKPTLGTVALLVVSLTIACVEKTTLEEQDLCFTKHSLETVPWIIKELKPYQDPKMMGCYVAVYTYRGEQFLGISHPFDCSPIGHVFNCAGVPFDSLGIDYSDFQDHRKLAAVLATIDH